jgi:hypothetical protein
MRRGRRAPRGRTRVPGLVGGAAALAVLLLAPIARAVTLTPPAESLVKPGTYATLVFGVDGEGQFAFEVDVPPAVQVLTSKGNVQVSGHAVVFVTAVVREGTEAGAAFTVALRLLDGGVETASARARLRVALDAGVSLQPVPELTARIGSPLYLHTTITNRGNARDRIELRAVYSKWRVHIAPSAVELDPGERASIDVTVTQTTLTSNGYRSVFYLEAASTNDPEVTTRVVVASRWYSSAVEGRPATAPQLVVSLETGVQANAKVYQGDFEGSLAYSVAPAIEGDLSDFVSGEAHTNRLAGDVSHPFANTPSGLSLALNAPSWNAAMDAYPGHYSVATHFDVGAWGVEVDGRLIPSPADTVYGVTVRGISQLPWLDLRLSAGSSQVGGTRTDSLRADYSVPLLPSLDLGLGAQLAGYDQPGQPYSVVAAVNQSFGWRNRDFEVSESYSGVPQSGTHSIGLSGGSRLPYPYGVRASTSYSFSPTDSSWTNYLTLYAQPLRGVTTDVRGSLLRTDDGISPSMSWTVSPHVVLAYSPSVDFGGSLGLGYTHGDVLLGDGPIWDRYSLGLNLGVFGVQLQLLGVYQESTAYADRPQAFDFKGAFTATYSFGLGTDLALGYAYIQSRTDTLSVEDDINASWVQNFANGVHTLVAYDRVLKPIEPSSSETVTLGVTVDDFLAPGVVLTGLYSLTSPTSVLDFATPGTHRFSLGISHTFEFAFDTPDVVVQSFGGRRGAELAGTAFLDANLDGVRQPEEAPLTGLTVAVAGLQTVTDGKGAFSLRVPEGTYQLSFPKGLPATVDLEGTAQVTLVENQDVKRDLAFAPVASLPVSVFYDDNDNGVRDEGEQGIPYGGVLIEGASSRSIQTDGDGNALATGLLPGSYTVRADAALLPPGMRATGEPVAVTLQPGERHDPVAVGAARPRREVVQTFAGSRLAVLPRVSPARVPRGAELQVQAFTVGEPTRVVVTLPGGADIPLTRREGGAWAATVRIDPDTPLGELKLTIRAEGDGAGVERDATVTVTDDPPFSPSALRGAVGTDAQLSLGTMFKAASARIVLPDGKEVSLTSEDGYHWKGHWQVPTTPGPQAARLLVDGEDVGGMTLIAVAESEPTGGQAAPGEGP